MLCGRGEGAGGWSEAKGGGPVTSVEGRGLILGQTLVEKYHKGGVEVGLCCEDVLAMRFKGGHMSRRDWGVQAVKGVNEGSSLRGVGAQKGRWNGRGIGHHG